MTSTPSGTRIRSLALLACGLTAATTLLAGCGNGLQSTAAGSGPVIAAPTAGPTAEPSSERSGSPTAVTSVTSATSAGPGSSTPGTATPSSRSDRCTTAHLQVGVRASQGGPAAGSDYVLLTYKNAGPAACVLAGYPGVSFVGHADGTQLGAPATRSAAASAKPVRVAVGRTTTSLLQIANAGNYDPAQCVPTTADGFRVYPPGSTTAVFVAFRTQACQRSTSGSPQLVASPVGTNG